MSRTHYQIYQEQTFVLAKTLIVKHEEIASSMNTELYYRGYEIDSNPYNWRYYLNLSGEYHQADKDELYSKYGTEHVMVKLPSDSGPIEVPLTKELLHGYNADKAMMNEYQIGSKFYTELVSRYPDFETLIIGILNPIDRGVAIKADNGEILFVAGRYKHIENDRRWFDDAGYGVNEVLIEPQEDNLIVELQRYINGFLRHWNNPDYIEGNDLYVVTMIGILYCNIPNAIFNIRLGNCKTPRTHSFHIRLYLESHGQIGRYIDFIPIASALWLYRNIEYLEANAGKQLTFDAILDNLLTPNEIPMSAYSIRHELSGMGDDKLLPNGMLYKEVLNFEVVGASDDDRTVADILNDQRGLARDNDKDLDIKERDIQETINWGGDDRLNTKVLESEMIELGEPYPFTHEQFLFNLWGYTALKGYYTGSAYATNPLTGDRLNFSAKNAYILATYCLNRSVAGVTLEHIPKIRLYHIPRTTMTDDLPSDVNYKIKPTTDTLMSWCVADKTRRLKVLEVVGTQRPQFRASDANEFYDNVRDIYDERVRKYNTYCDVEEFEERGDLELIAKRLYWMGFEETLQVGTYEDWFRTIGFDPTVFDDNDLMNLGIELVASATGVLDKEDSRKKWLQRSLLSIMKHFISYTVQIIEKYADGAVAYLEGQTLRFSDFEWTYTQAIPVRYNISLDYHAETIVRQAIRIDISNVFENVNVDIKANFKKTYELDFGLQQTDHRMDVGVYSLSSQIMNIALSSEEAVAVYIRVVDDSVNHISMAAVTTVVSNGNETVTIIDSINSIRIVNQSGTLSDETIESIVHDTIPVGITVDGIYTDLDEGDTRTKTRVDTSGVAITDIVGEVTDSSLETIHHIDMGVISPQNITTKTDSDVSQERDVSDKSSAAITDINASITDNDVTINQPDTNTLLLAKMSVSLTDPQIPGIETLADDIGTTIINVTGGVTDNFTDLTGFDDNTVVMHTIEVDIAEPNVELTLDTDIAVTMNAITGTLNDMLIDHVLLDINAMSISNITMSYADESVIPGFVDDITTMVSGITLARSERAAGANIDVGSVTPQGITGLITDAVAVAITIVDNDAIIDANVTLSYRDSPSPEIVNDTNGITTVDISMSTIDDALSTHELDVINHLTVNDITGVINDARIPVKIRNDIAVVVDGISAVISNEGIELSVIDVNTLYMSEMLLTVSVTDE